MSTLPTMPACGLRASVRIEAYAPRDGLAHGELDAIVDVCAVHVATVSALLREAGYTVYRPDGAPEGKLCGDGIDYTQPGLPALKSAATPVHFPYGHVWSCGRTLHEQTSTDRSEVTCVDCLGEAAIAPQTGRWPGGQGPR